MCRRTTCRTCGKATWAGCGNHIEQALAGVPRNQRCSCSAASAASGRAAGTGASGDSGGGSGSGASGGWLSRLFGR